MEVEELGSAEPFSHLRSNEILSCLCSDNGLQVGNQIPEQLGRQNAWVVDSLNVVRGRWLRLRSDWSPVGDLVEKPKVYISIVCVFLKTLGFKQPANWMASS